MTHFRRLSALDGGMAIANQGIAKSETFRNVFDAGVDGHNFNRNVALTALHRKKRLRPCGRSLFGEVLSLTPYGSVFDETAAKATGGRSDHPGSPVFCSRLPSAVWRS